MPIINKALESLNPRFKPIVLEILTRLEAKGYQAAVIEGLRTKEQQAEKVRLGYSTTMHSYHLTGFAADICDKRYLWNIPLSHPFWKDLGDIVLDLSKQNPGLRWGGVWAVGKMERFTDYLKGRTKYFVDVAHVELRI